VYGVRYTIRMLPVKRRRRPRIQTADVIARAVAIVDAEGVDALSIRRLARDCGLSAMGIYRHVRDKDELLDAVVNAVTAKARDNWDALPGGWQAQADEMFREMRLLFLDHPGVAALCVNRPTPVPEVMRVTNQFLAVFRNAGFRPEEAVLAYDALMLFTFASVLWELPRIGNERERIVAFAEGDSTAGEVRAHAKHLVRRDAMKHFEYGLDVIIKGIASRRGRAGDPSRKRASRRGTVKRKPAR
jgi:AcrR family transcriptional regulator